MEATHTYTHKKHKPYPAYKDSGIDWLGEIPAGWEVKKIKRFCLVKRGASPRPIEDPIYFDDNGEYSWVRISDVSASNKYLYKTTQRLSDLGKSKSISLELDEIFLSIAATVGKPIITKIKCCIHDGFVYFVGLKEFKEYLYYIFSGGELYKGIGKFGTQLNLNTDTIGDIYLPIPPLPEQHAIAEYLDRETARLDTLIEKKQRLIELLREKRAALITRAVTKGLNPDEPKKDSGIDWLGEIPVGWEVKKLKYSVNLINEKTDVLFDIQIYIGMENIESWTGKYLNNGSYNEIIGISNTFKKNDLLFGKLRPYLAKVFKCHSSGVCSSEFLVLRCINNSMNYLFYLLLSKSMIENINSSTYGTKMPRASWEYIGNIIIPIPPLPDQRAIAEFLDRETAKLDKLIEKIQTGIDKLKEYRTALISAAVTGKIDVRDQVK